jgi:hypothetical protein
MSDVVAVYLEIGTKRTFAGAIEWPGWCRSGRSEDEALQALVAYGPRYAAIVGGSSPQFHAPGDVADLKVVERLKGGSGTDFGVPGVAPAADRRPLDAGELARLCRLLTECWSAFDAAAAAAAGVELRKGPRGGGRDLPKIVTHVKEADEAYLVQLGARRPKERGPDEAAETDRLHVAMLEAFSARARGEPLAEPNRVKKPWTPRYFVRRSAWHVIDHAWEIQDRATAEAG